MSMQAGLFCFDGRPIHEEEAAAISGWASLSEAQPPGRWSGDGVLIVHADSSQPQVTATAVITFDGRLDNRDDLDLRLRHVVPEQASDGARALAIYESDGPDGLVSLIGDWSLCIWDRLGKRLMLASDFAGVRPLYYSVSRSCVMWSTSLRPLCAHASAHEIDDEYVAGLLIRGGCPNRTPYRGVHPVPPGNCLIVSAEGIAVRPFWTLPFADSVRYKDEAEYEEHLRHLFRDAVRCRMRVDTPILAELSGGLDSSSIVSMANHLIRSGEVTAPTMITLTYERENSRDRHFQDILESFCQFERAHLSTKEYAFLAETHTGGAMPAFWEQLHLAVSTLARERGAQSIITGSLGDLIMGNWWDDSAQVLRLFRTGRCLAGFREALAWSRTLGIPITWVLWRAARTVWPPAAASAMTGLSEGAHVSANREDSISQAFGTRMGLSDRRRFMPQACVEAPPERRGHFRALREAIELRRLKPPEPLEHLSYTHPYAHRPLVQFMLSIPADIVCRAGEPRRLMRRAFRGFWPRELEHRRSKDSFGGVFLDSLRPLAAALLKEPGKLEVVERGYVDPVSFTNRLERVTHSLECNEPQLRQIILLEFWLRGHFRSSGRPMISARQNWSLRANWIERGPPS